MGMSQRGYVEMRDRLRWRVALVLLAMLGALTLVLAGVNTRMGYADTALLAWIAFGVTAACAGGLAWLPRRLGATVFFATVLGLVVLAVGFGWWHGRPLHPWGFLFPPVVVFLLPAWRAMAAMLVFGAAVALVVDQQRPAIEVVRFVSVYGLMVCFVTTYALLEERASRLLRDLGDRDGLTGALNRRRFNEALARFDADRAGAAALGVLLVDVDHFKAVNDSRGHLEGDRVLAALAAALERGLAAHAPEGQATLYRYGGEEFAVLVHDRLPGPLGLLAEALRSAVAAGGGGLAPGEVTVSIGAAAWRGGGETPEAALQRADDALYAAKRGGRNRVVVSEAPRAPAAADPGLDALGT